MSVSARSLAVPLAIVSVSAMIGLCRRSEHDYYEPSSFNFLMPVSAIYSSLAPLWVFATLRQLNLNIVKPLPSIDDDDKNNQRRIAIVTGSNTGIGFETAKALVVDYGWEVILACRTKEKAMKAMDEINRQASSAQNMMGGVAVVLETPLDLSSFASIQRYSADLQQKYENKTIDALVNNAGRNTSGKAPGDLDLLFTSNFLGHFFLTNLLIDNLRGGRIVNLSSVMHHFAGTQTKDTDYWTSIMAYHDPPLPHVYSASKLAAVLFTVELNRRFSESHGIKSIAVNPGGVASDIWRDFPVAMQSLFRKIYLTPKQGASTTVAAVVGQTWGEDTIYLQPFWQSDKISTGDVPPAFAELHGPYVGYFPSRPRLPDTDGVAAAKALWDAANTVVEKTIQ